MNISEALSELKNKKTRLARLITIRENTLKYNNTQPKPEKSFEDLSKEIEGLAEEARGLKTKIARANTTTKIGAKELLEGKEAVTLNELILQQGDIRSEIAALKKILGGSGRRAFESSIFDGYGDEKVTFQKSRFEIEEMIQKLEKEKRSVDASIQKINWGTELK